MPLTTADKLINAALKLQKSYDSEAFRYLYEELSPKVYFVCLRYLKEEDEAKDVLQEVFVIVYEKIKTFKGKGSFEGWVKRIAVRQCIHRLKKKKISTELKEGHIPSTEQKEFDSGKEDQTLKEQLKHALKHLPNGYRTIINLYVLEGYSHPEIAQMLNITEGTSRSQLKRAKAALRKQISARK